MLPTFLVLLLASASAAHAGRLTGTVRDAAGHPVEGAYVRAMAGEPPEIVAQAQSDGNGRYNLDAPEGLFTLTVNARGYYILSAGGLKSETVTHSCPASGGCGEVDFQLGKPGVVEGWLTDRFGDPVSRVMVRLQSAEAAAGQTRRPQAMGFRQSGSSDDRGYFRIWNVRPGRYVLDGDPRMERFGGFGPSYRLPPQEIEIGEQGKTIEVRLAVDSADSLHTISGTIEGIETREGTFAFVRLRRRGTNQGDYRPYAVSHDGRFTIAGLNTGDYTLRLITGNGAQKEPTFRTLGELHIDRDLTDLRLTPQAGASLRIKVGFHEMAKRNLDLLLRPTDDAGVPWYLIVRGPSYEAEASGLVAGNYELRLQNPDCYLARPYPVTLQDGQTTLLTIEIGNQFASLHGQVRVGQAAAREGAAHFTVGARGPHGRYKMQTDDDGRFVFAKLPPGSYKIAAWPKPDIDPEDDQAWDDARGVVNVDLDPGFDVEMDVTVNP